MLIKDLLSDIIENINSIEHFQEEKLFTEPIKLKQFQDHFRNVSLIMDCVGCDKCKLWGKLQITGLGTAFKILSTDNPKLNRQEIVSIFNAFGRLSTSIQQLSIFRQLY